MTFDHNDLVDNTPYAIFPTNCHINTAKLGQNYLKVKNFINHDLMAVIKGDAYGHGLGPSAQALAAVGCQTFGVMDLNEALSLKTHYPQAEVYIITGCPDPAWARQALEAGIIIFATDVQQTEMLSREAVATNTTARIWLKVDTGMGRLGLPAELLPSVFKDLLALKNLKIEGIATHLATNGDLGAKTQLERLSKLGNTLASSYKSLELKYSTLASGGILAHHDFPDSLSRTGLMLYGYSPLNPADEPLSGDQRAQELVLSLEPVMTVRTRLIQVREVKAGETISYDRTYEVTKAMVMGTVLMGYVHGVSRNSSSLGQVLIKGQVARQIGRVCMNLMMFDITDIPAQVGDEVVIMGQQNQAFIGADQIAAWQNANSYEVLCRLGLLNHRTWS
jgi:alanine racemase